MNSVVTVRENRRHFFRRARSHRTARSRVLDPPMRRREQKFTRAWHRLMPVPAGTKLGVWGQEEEGKNSEEKARNNEKGPENRGLGVEFVSPFQGGAKLLLFLRSSLLFRGGLFCCALHRLILPNIKFCDQKSQCDSYIRLFARKVKKKMRRASHSDLFRVASPRTRERVFARPSHLDRARHSYIQLNAGSQ